MSNREMFSYKPKPGPPTAGREYYMPDEHYFIDTNGFPIMQAARVAARCVSLWADRYLAFLVWAPSTEKAGFLPSDPEARQVMIDDLFDWFDRNWNPDEPEGEPEQCGLLLRRGDILVLDAHDGLPGILELTPAEFTNLQSCLADFSLPRDLYYPLRNGRLVTEPVQKHGGVVRERHWYSPLRWARRDHGAIAKLQVPNDEEQQRRFLRACDQFRDELLLRIAELHEPGRRSDPEEAKRLAAAMDAVSDVERYVRDRSPASHEKNT